MPLDNNDLLVVQKAGGGELRKTSVQTLLSQGDALWQENATTLYPKTTTVKLGIGPEPDGSFNIALNPNGAISSTGAHLIYRDGAEDAVVNGYLNGTRTVRIAADGTAQFGGTLGGNLATNAPNISLNADGSITASNQILTQRDNADQYAFRVNVPGSSLPAFGVFGDGTTNIGGSIPSAPNIELNANGSADFVNQKLKSWGFAVVNNDGAYESVFRTNTGTNTPGGQIKGNVFIGSDPANPSDSGKISLNASGSAEFAGNVVVGGTTAYAYETTTISGQSGQIFINTDGIKTALGIAPNTDASPAANTVTIKGNGSATFAGLLTVNEAVRADRTNPNQQCFSARLNGTANAQIFADGSATFAGDIGIGGTLPSSPNITLNANGAGEFGGTIGYQSVPAVRAQSDQRSGNTYGDVAVYADRGIISDNTAPAYRARVRNAANSAWEDRFLVTWDGSATFAGRINSTKAGANVGFIGVSSDIILAGTDDDYCVRAGTGSLQLVTGTGAGVVALEIDDLQNSYFAGDIGIGGTLPSAPNIELTKDGLATISQFLRVNNEPTGDQHVRLSGSSTRAFGVSQLKNPSNAQFTAQIRWDGSASFAGDVNTKTLTADVSDDVNKSFAGIFRTNTAKDGDTTVYIQNRNNDGKLIAGNNSSSETFTVNADGSAEFAGDITAQNFNIDSLPSLP